MKSSIFAVAAIVAIVSASACSSSSSSSGGGGAVAPTCTARGDCGSTVKNICVTNDSDGNCVSEYYSVGTQRFDCNSCSDCVAANTSSVTACESADEDGGADGAAPSDFAGMWSCSGQIEIIYTPSSDPSTDNAAAGTLAITASGTSVSVTIEAEDAGAPCTLNFTSSGDTAMLASGTMMCGTGSSAQTISSATLMYAEGMLSFSAQITQMGTAILDDASTPVTAMGDLTEVCTKM